MTDKLERTLIVEAPIDRVWRAFSDPEVLRLWYIPRIEAFEAWPGGRVEFLIPHANGAVVGEVLEVEAPRRLTWREGPGLLPGTTEITVRLTPVERGTEIHHVHAGLGSGPEWADEIQSHDLGWSQCLHDLALYLKSGVRPVRATKPKSRMGIVSLDVDEGLEVVGVQPGSFADRVGLRVGDVVIRLNGGSVFGRRELWFFASEHAAGEEVAVEWIRGGEVLDGSSTLDGAPSNASDRLQFTSQGSTSAR